MFNKRKKGIVLIITLSFVVTISFLFLQNLFLVQKYIKENNFVQNLIQLNIYYTNIKTEILNLSMKYETKKEFYNILEDKIIVLEKEDLIIDFDINNRKINVNQLKDGFKNIFLQNKILLKIFTKNKINNIKLLISLLEKVDSKKTLNDSIDEYFNETGDKNIYNINLLNYFSFSDILLNVDNINKYVKEVFFTKKELIKYNEIENIYKIEDLYFLTSDKIKFLKELGYCFETKTININIKYKNLYKKFKYKVISAKYSDNKFYLND